MICLLDTNAFSDLMREHPKADARLASIVAPDRVAICSIVRGESCYGIERLPQGKRQQELETKAASLFAAIPCEGVPAAAGGYYATVKLIRERKSLGVDENDLWIAATDLALGATLVSRDGAFQQVDGLFWLKTGRSDFRLNLRLLLVLASQPLRHRFPRDKNLPGRH